VCVHVHSYVHVFRFLCARWRCMFHRRPRFPPPFPFPPLHFLVHPRGLSPLLLKPCLRRMIYVQVDPLPAVATTGTIVNGVPSLGVVLTSTDCSLAVEHVEVWCVVPSGGGAGFVWSVVVDGQSSAPSLQNTSYAPPIVAAIGVSGSGTFEDEPDAVPTSGGAIVTLSGSNFGGSRTGGVCGMESRRGPTHATPSGAVQTRGSVPSL
jgi:hypothetical protein